MVMTMRCGLFLILISAATLTLGCGGDDPADPGGAGPAPTDATRSADGPEAAADTPGTQPAGAAATQPATTTQPGGGDGAAGVEFAENFDAMATGDLPDTMPALVGAFEVVEAPAAVGEAGRVLMLPGQPLHQQDTGVLFGPNVKDGVAVAASFWAQRTGRRYPRYGVGLSGATVYKLRVLAAARQLQLTKYDDLVASAPIDWPDGAWVRVRLALTRTGDAWQLTGKAWPADEDPPTDPQLTWTDDEEPWPGQASVWATPFSGKPIYIDQITLTPID